MCGIAGIWNLDGAPVSREAIDRFTDSLAHRGPDGRGVWTDDNGFVALGHRRLAILDLSDDGRQPMSYGDGRWWIVFNGEIFNFVELRSELEGKGHSFRSASDTEVILAAWAEWGEEMLLRFNGMWALAIYDRQERSLFIARDRFGIKPFHYLLTPERFAFASELKSFTRLDGFSPGIDRESAAVFLRDGFAIEGTRRTMLEGVRRLQGGHCGTLRGGRLTVRRWWNTLDHLEEPPATLEGQAERFRELFYDAVKLRMRSDVPIGSCLSGGFDSSAVVCALAEIGRKHPDLRQAADWQQTFIATFPGAFNDESEEAAEVVRFAGVKGSFFPVTDGEALGSIDRVLYDFDDVYIGMPTAAWLIYRELRRAGVVVSLDGHGADELMGAYLQADYLLFHDAPSLVLSPRRNLELVRQYRQVLERFSRFGTTGGLMSPATAFLANHPSFRSLRKAWSATKEIRKSAAGRSFVRDVQVFDDEDFRPVGAGDRLPEQWGEINRRLYPMFHSTILPTILRNFDRMSMAHGVEIRMPFLDWRLVRYLFSLPDEAKVGNTENKRVAREAMRGRMPETIRAAKHKIGFNSPMPEWFNGPLKPWLTEIAESRETLEHDLIDGKMFASYVKRHAADGSWSWQNCGAVWPVMHYLWFERTFLGGMDR